MTSNDRVMSSKNHSGFYKTTSKYIQKYLAFCSFNFFGSICNFILDRFKFKQPYIMVLIQQNFGI